MKSSDQADEWLAAISMWEYKGNVPGGRIPCLPNGNHVSAKRLVSTRGGQHPGSPNPTLKPINKPNHHLSPAQCPSTVHVHCPPHACSLISCCLFFCGSQIRESAAIKRTVAIRFSSGSLSYGLHTSETVVDGGHRASCWKIVPGQCTARPTATSLGCLLAIVSRCLLVSVPRGLLVNVSYRYFSNNR